MITARGLTKRYRDLVALDDVSLTVADGECVAVVGESGSGKSTLLRCVNRLVHPEAGRLQVAGEDVAQVDPVMLRRGIGYVPQDGGLLPHWTVRRNAALVPWLMGRAQAETQAAAALELVGLPVGTFGARYPAELSGGQRQRVAIARAIASHPPVLLMDEPFGALDAITRAELQSAFAALRRRLAGTVLFVTHDLREAFFLADRVAVLRGGRLEQVDAPSTLRAAPASDYVRQLLTTSGVA